MVQKSIFNINSNDSFEALALELFNYQFEHNTTYRSFCDLLYRHPSDVQTTDDIPFLPIDFFKTHQVTTKGSYLESVLCFESSGTTGSQTSKHYVHDPSLYEQSFLTNFQLEYGAIEDYVILALLPSYLERKGSSLVYMVDVLIKKSGHQESGFFLHDHFALRETILRLEERGQKTLLLGVSYALLDFAATYPLQLKHTLIMETGGMKGRHKELVRSELHEQLCKGFGVSHIHSEYGMTELLSQAYSKGDGVFSTPPWMKIFIRDPEDPFYIHQRPARGGLNIIDLCNMHSCAFIATQDIGKQLDVSNFLIEGRFDHSDIRGCNLLAI